MKILFIVPYVPNLIRVRPYQIIRHLTQHGHQVTVMTLWSNDAERQAVEELRSSCHAVIAYQLPKWRSFMNVAAAFPGQSPLQANYCWQPELAERIIATIWPDNHPPVFDVIHVEHLRGARYGQHVISNFDRDGCVSLPVIWDSVDCITHLFRQSSAKSNKLLNRVLTRFELSRTQKHEAMLVRLFDRVLVTSKNDREAFFSLNDGKTPIRDIEVLPNGVALDYFSPGTDPSYEPNTLVISGKMSYHANVSMVLYFVNQILPIVRESHPAVKVIIVGKDPPASIQALAKEGQIEVTGTVADIRPYLRRAAVAVAPLTYGAGIQNKVLEAMACGIPVVTTPRAVSALNVQVGSDLLTASSEVDFAREICRLLDDRGLRAHVGRAGRLYVEENHRWSDITARLAGIYQHAIDERMAAEQISTKSVNKVLPSV